jgi:hypothetical protein
MAMPQWWSQRFFGAFSREKKRKMNFPFVIRSFFRTFAGTNEKY